MVYPLRASAKVSKNEPQPEEQASLQHDVVDRAVPDFKAFHILPADVHDEVNIGVEMAGGIQVRDRFHKAEVAVKGVFDQILAIAGRPPHRRS